jgi:hypothetical protein
LSCFLAELQFFSLQPNFSSSPKWWKTIEEALEIARKYQFFHWELEFPDAFKKNNKGFDLIIMNPPWEVYKPEDDDFFSVYYPRFRRIKSKPEKKKVMKRLLRKTEIATAYQEYTERINDKMKFFKTEHYSKQGRGDKNLWKLFLERVINLVSDEGSYGLVIPSGIVTDLGTKQLRETLLSNRIRSMFEFGKRQKLETLIDEEALLLAKYLRDERKTWIPRIAKL